ncbi:hypothetical protein EV646_108424 [Kribbella antiqua]|uniref:4-amino-4-deoxy-L-arabinose transferase-like glycosyltransferase n=1 Tax=Kribbella antiqua TaxID=2512217 RepID=A0A4V2S3V3_9ACTN|nr:hypothetical protein [Kribbella antiqua]TCO45800.1 hypothetical protein EV646_108424 [Kribbella antiqua]
MRRAFPWLLPLAVAVYGLASVDVSATPILKYFGYFALGVALPGILLLRAAWRSTGNWAEDFGLGSVVGAAWQMIGWAIFTAVGVQRWLIVWPAIVLVLFAAVPTLRRHWRIERPNPLPVLWSWGVAIACAVVLGGTTLGVMAYHLMPPEGNAYYQDLLYHLSMLNELMRAVPPELPQVAGLRLDYHWFANADMAGAVDITRLSPAMVLFRLWLLPWLVVVLLTCATLARTVSRTWWTGVLAAGALAAPQLYLFFDTTANLSAPLNFLSPSQTFCMTACLAAAVFLIELLFRGASGGLWVVTLAVVLLGGGSKPTVLPLLVGAVGLSAVFLLFHQRRFPWRAVVAGALLVVAGVGAFLTVAGSTNGSGLQFLAILKSAGEYLPATGDRTPPGEGGLVLPALEHGAYVAVTVLFLLLLISQAAAVAGFGLFGKLRRDPAAWFLLGALIAGWAGYLLIDHPSLSEGYFVHTAMPFSIAAATWVAANAARTAKQPWVLLAVGVVVATGYAAVLMLTDAYEVGTQSQKLWLVARPLLLAIGMTIVLVLLWRFVVRRPGGVIIVVVTLLLLGSIKSFAYNVVHGDTERAHVFNAPRWWVYPDEESAAIWLGQNSAPTDVVASNTWCRPAGSQAPGCDARGYIISGIAGRRTLIEGWAYTNQAMAQQGVDGKRYNMQPSPWPDRVAITNEALRQPTPQVLQRLQDDYHVRWLFADGRDGVINWRLDKLARLRHSVGDVRIYELGK